MTVHELGLQHVHQPISHSDDPVEEPEDQVYLQQIHPPQISSLGLVAMFAHIDDPRSKKNHCLSLLNAEKF